MRCAWFVLGIALVGCGGGKGGPLDGDCTGLSLFDCRTTPGCQAELCAGCACDLSYGGCISITEIPDPCPQLGCPAIPCCSDGTECDEGASCAQPGTDTGCGSCNSIPGDCTTDSECTGTSICEPIRCSCEAEKQCVPGCLTNTDCTDEGTTCDVPSSRCVASPCVDDDDCPSNFTCGGGSTCARKACDDDLECDGFCVLGSCFPGARGECRLPVP